MTNHQLLFTSEVLTNVLSMHFAWIHFLMASNNIYWRRNRKMLNLQIFFSKQIFPKSYEDASTFVYLWGIGKNIEREIYGNTYETFNGILIYHDLYGEEITCIKKTIICFMIDVCNFITTNSLLYIWFLIKSKTNIWFRIKHVLAARINVVYDLTYGVCLWLQICRS